MRMVAEYAKKHEMVIAGDQDGGEEDRGPPLEARSGHCEDRRCHRDSRRGLHRRHEPHARRCRLGNSLGKKYGFRSAKGEVESTDSIKKLISEYMEEHDDVIAHTRKVYEDIEILRSMRKELVAVDRGRPPAPSDRHDRSLRGGQPRPSDELRLPELPPRGEQELRVPGRRAWPHRNHEPPGRVHQSARRRDQGDRGAVPTARRAPVSSATTSSISPWTTPRSRRSGWSAVKLTTRKRTPCSVRRSWRSSEILRRRPRSRASSRHTPSCTTRSSRRPRCWRVGSRLSAGSAA